MRLHIFVEEFIIEPDRGVPGSAIKVDRRSGTISELPEASRDALDLSQAHSQYIFGVIGAVKLLRGRYLIVATNSDLRTTLPGNHQVRQLTEAIIVPYSSGKVTEDLATAAQRDDEVQYLKLIDRVLRCGAFHFSRTIDLTHSMQRMGVMSYAANAEQKSMWDRADERFVWNRYLAEEFVSKGFGDWVLPLMNGFVTCDKCVIKGKDAYFALISRRSCKRAGRRYTARGLDEEGNAANFAETEQVLFIPDGPDATRFAVYAFLQTRGSIPLVWQQLVTLKYMPTPEFSVEQSATAFEKHFKQQIGLYGRQILVNLIDQKGKELILEKALQQQVTSAGNKDVRLLSFDFHKECKGMRYENIEKLVTQLLEEFEGMKYFVGSLDVSDPSLFGHITVKGLQKGTFRVNCMDCLDRTNVVQSVFARRILEEQLRDAGISAKTDKSKGFGSPDFEKIFKTVWTDNADAMSMQYAGTGALKTEYTRTGKYTKKGQFIDLTNSARRYILNNFFDGSNQDSLDLFLGRYVPSKDSPSPFESMRNPKRKLYRHFVAQILAAVVAFFFLWSALGPSLRVWTPARGFMMFLFFIVFPLALFKAGEKHGKDYVNAPSLVPLKSLKKPAAAFIASSLPTKKAE